MALVALGVETRDEVLTLCAFHVLGVVLEIFKTNPAIGSWSYPEQGSFEVFGVPLYSGFMYASVASYMCQAWRLLDLDLKNYPPYALSVPLSVGIYLNFFSHHFIPDLRWVLAAGVFLVFFRTRVLFTATNRCRSMPLVVSFLFIGFFVWIAENLSTYLGAWTYPGQAGGWKVVSLQKISSWCLLVIVSFVIVADLKHARAERRSDWRAGRATAKASRSSEDGCEATAFTWIPQNLGAFYPFLRRYLLRSTNATITSITRATTLKPKDLATARSSLQYWPKT